VRVGYVQSKSNLLLNNAELAVVAEVKYLRVTADSRHNFDIHIRQAVARAFVRANLIHTCFVSRKISTLLRAFLQFILYLLYMHRAYGCHTV